MFFESLLGLDFTLNLLLCIVYGLLQSGVGLPTAHALPFLAGAAMLSALPAQPQAYVLWAMSALGLYLFRGFFATIFLLVGFVANLYAMGSCNALAIYICFELQSLCLVVLAKVSGPRGAQAFVLRAALKYLLFSVIAGSVLLFYVSTAFVHTGQIESSALPVYFFLLFKMGIAPFHMYMLELFTAVPRALAFVFTTVPKFSVVVLLSALQIDGGLLAFALSSMLVGSLSAYQGVFLRRLILYSSVTEMGLTLGALLQGFTSAALLSLVLYFLGTLMLWNSDLSPAVAVATLSVAGLPPLAGFFGKAQLISAVLEGGAGHTVGVLLVAQSLAFVGYLRLVRLFCLQGVAHLGQTTSAGLLSALPALLFCAGPYLGKPF